MGQVSAAVTSDSPPSSLLPPWYPLHFPLCKLQRYPPSAVATSHLNSALLVVSHSRRVIDRPQKKDQHDDQHQHEHRPRPGSLAASTTVLSCNQIGTLDKLRGEQDELEIHLNNPKRNAKRVR